MPYPDDENPYSAPVTDLSAPELLPEGASPEAERIRNQNLPHERSVKSLGLLDYLASGFGFLSGLTYTILAIQFANLRVRPEQAGVIRLGMIALAVLSLGVGVLLAFLGRGLRQFRPWARWTQVVLTTLGFLYLLVMLGATILGGGGFYEYLTIGVSFSFNLYIYYVLLSSRSGLIFSPAYAEVIAQTPHIQSRTSIIVKIALGLLVGFVVLGVFGALLSTFFLNDRR